MPGKKPQRVWLRSSREISRPQMPDALKERVQREGDALVAEVLRPRAVKPPPDDPWRNHVIDVFTRWHRSWFYFGATYASPGPNALSATFETRFARLEYAGGEQFHLAYMRHTGQWHEVFRDLPLTGALLLIREEPYFMI